MKFSIIVPIYNVEKYLRQCVDSILMQDFTDYELLLIDDGSPDSCPAICDEYASKDKRIKVVHKKNGGLVSARKTGTEIAGGEYILNVDGDDWLEVGYLEKINQFIEKSNNADVIAWGYTAVTENDGKPVYHKLAEGLYRDDSLERVREIYLYDKNEKGTVCDSVIITITKAVRRELYCKCQNLVDERTTKGEDAMMGWFLLLHCKSFYIAEYAGYMYRMLASSMSHKLKVADFEILDVLISEMQKNVPKNYVNQIRCYCLFRLMDLFTLASREYEYKEYRRILKENLRESLLNFALKGKIYRKRVHERIKLLLLNLRAWRILYIILRNY